jgi:EpsI family protein
LLVVAPQAAKRWIDSTTSNAAVHLVPAAKLSAQWATVGSSALTEFKPAFQNASAEFKTSYAGPKGEVGLYIGYYRQQGSQRKLVASSNVLVPSLGSPWNQVAHGLHTLDAAGRQLSVRTTTLRRAPSGAAGSQADLLVWQIYWVNGGFTASDPIAKAQIALGKLLGRGDDSAALVFYAPSEPNGAAALQAFVEANLPAIEQQLVSTRDVRR